MEWPDTCRILAPDISINLVRISAWEYGRRHNSTSANRREVSHIDLTTRLSTLGYRRQYRPYDKSTTNHGSGSRKQYPAASAQRTCADGETTCASSSTKFSRAALHFRELHGQLPVSVPHQHLPQSNRNTSLSVIPRWKGAPSWATTASCTPLHRQICVSNETGADIDIIIKPRGGFSSSTLGPILQYIRNGQAFASCYSNKLI